ncbi:hypothetical protein [Cystobacter fuscus]|nr:hypothetical protein [Cystobacter fuscus]
MSIGSLPRNPNHNKSLNPVDVLAHELSHGVKWRRREAKPPP